MTCLGKYFGIQPDSFPAVVSHLRDFGYETSAGQAVARLKAEPAALKLDGALQAADGVASERHRTGFEQGAVGRRRAVAWRQLREAGRGGEKGACRQGEFQHGDLRKGR